MPDQKETHTLSIQEDEEISEFLERIEARLYKLAWQLVPQNSFARDDLDLIVSDIVQNTLVNFWQAARKEEILHPQSYIQTILHHEIVNLVRKRSILPLPLSTDNELVEEAVLIASGKVGSDPPVELVQQETTHEIMQETIKMVATFPRRQKWAFLFWFKERVDDRDELLDALEQYNLDADELLPPTQEEMPTYRSSLSIARKRVREKLSKFLKRNR
jgi:DNA-directed RNA polymerase specialized sigma24 family protein